MGKYDAQIKQAIKIGAGWVEKAEGYSGSFYTIKKEHLALEKGDLAKIQLAVSRGDPNLTDHLDELESAKERLQMFYNEGKKLIDEFDKWALAEPRSNMGFIAKKLGLGAVNTEAYKEVAAGIKNQLTDVAKALADTQRAWRSDLEIALKNHLEKVDTLEKVIRGDIQKSKAFCEQLDKAIDRFAEECGKVYAALKVEALMKDVEDVMSGKMAEVEKVKIEQKYHQTQQKLALIPALEAQITKNRDRVVKTMPPGFLDGFIASSRKKRLTDVYADTQKKMTYATKLCESAIKSYESKNLV